MKMVLMGTGTSHGVPVIGCKCKVCKSSDPRDYRLRCSGYIFDPVNVVVDTGPEFRLQALKYNIEKVDAVFLTHAHADHLNGLDDLRVFSHTKAIDPAHPENVETEGNGLPIYANSRAIEDVEKRFDYIFKPVKEGGGKPKLDLQDIKQWSAENPVVVQNESKKIIVVPVPLMHGSLPDSGFIFTEETDGCKKSIAYLTDCNFIEESSFNIIENCGQLEHLVIDALRVEPHSTHFGFEEALAAADRIQAKHTWFTHLTHNMSHVEIDAFIKEKLPAYKNLQKIVEEGGSILTAWDGMILET